MSELTRKQLEKKLHLAECALKSSEADTDNFENQLKEAWIKIANWEEGHRTQLKINAALINMKTDKEAVPDEYAVLQFWDLDYTCRALHEIEERVVKLMNRDMLDEIRRLEDEIWDRMLASMSFDSQARYLNKMHDENMNTLIGNMCEKCRPAEPEEGATNE